jgi:hypothetical protein
MSRRSIVSRSSIFHFRGSAKVEKKPVPVDLEAEEVHS